MRKLSCLIIEDENLLADVLAEYINQVPFLELKQVFSDGMSALEYLEVNNADLIFIDINLPKLKGIDFIRMFPTNAKYIITTAYHEYAVEGFTLNVVDYLLKPISFDRFIMAVNKVNDGGIISARPVSENLAGKDYFYINMNKRRVKVNFSEILYIEGLKEYVKIHVTREKLLITKMQIGHIQELLNEDFVRIHRSFIVSRKKVNSYNQVEVNVGNSILPVGTNYKESIGRLLEG
jgi:DNA-binding LytR/AlgR family response regulator